MIMAMELPDLVTLALNSGTAVLVICYFIFRDLKFTKSLQETLTTLVNQVATLKEIVTHMKGKGGSNENGN